MPKFLQEDMLDKVEHILAYGAIATLFLCPFRTGYVPLSPRSAC